MPADPDPADANAVEPIVIPPPATKPLHVDQAAAGLAARRARILADIGADQAIIDEARARIRAARASLETVDRMLRAAKGPTRGKNKPAS
jgi:vacuolar-type H+-ATPase subunit I/STV1